MSALDTQVAGTHYKNRAIQPVEYIHANGLGFLEGCASSNASPAGATRTVLQTWRRSSTRWIC